MACKHRGTLKFVTPSNSDSELRLPGLLLEIARGRSTFSPDGRLVFSSGSMRESA